jgi:hypothetical protein
VKLTDQPDNRDGELLGGSTAFSCAVAKEENREIPAKNKKCSLILKKQAISPPAKSRLTKMMMIPIFPLFQKAAIRLRFLKAVLFSQIYSKVTTPTRCILEL